MGKEAKRRRAEKARRGGPDDGSNAGLRPPRCLMGVAESEIDDTVDAWGLLNCYLQLLAELDPAYPVSEEFSAQDPVTARRLAEGFASARPHIVLGLREDATFFMSRIASFDVAAKTILGDLKACLQESGYQPNLREWFADASMYARIMVAEGDRQRVLALLDYDNLKSASDEVDRIFGVSEHLNATLPPIFTLDLGPDNNWLGTARGMGRTAGLHALGCLAVSLFFLPGAVKDLKGTLVSFGQRGVEGSRFVTKWHEQPDRLQ